MINKEWVVHKSDKNQDDENKFLQTILKYEILSNDRCYLNKEKSKIKYCSAVWKKNKFKKNVNKTITKQNWKKGIQHRPTYIWTIITISFDILIRLFQI